MSSPGHIDDNLLTQDGGDETMESEANALLDDSTSNSEHIEQVLQGDKDDAHMEVTPTEVAVVKATAEDMSLQETVCEDGTKDATKTSEKDASKEVDNKVPTE